MLMEYSFLIKNRYKILNLKILYSFNMLEEIGYLALLSNVLLNGEEREGRNGKVYSIFGEKLEFNLKTGFPLLTTKKVFLRGIAEELFWFLRGSTNANELIAKDIHIWDGNTSREFLDSVGLHHLMPGYLGAGYGHCWRSFGGDYPSKETYLERTMRFENSANLFSSSNGPAKKSSVCEYFFRITTKTSEMVAKSLLCPTVPLK